MPNDKPISFMVFPQLSLEIREFLHKVVLTYIWVLASTLDPSVSKINEALSVTYKLLFILSKNIVPSRSYRYIRDRTFPVTACQLPPPIYTKFDVKQRYIDTQYLCIVALHLLDRYIDTGVTESVPVCKRVNFYTIIDKAISDPRSWR